MKKTSASIIFGVLLDVIFALVFFLLLSQWSINDEEITLHMNQIGMFKEIENSENCIEKLNNIGLKGYSYQKDDLFIVVTSVSLEKTVCLDEQKILSTNDLSFILKEVTTSDSRFIEAVKQENIEKVMELMAD